MPEVLPSPTPQPRGSRTLLLAGACAPGSLQHRAGKAIRAGGGGREQGWGVPANGCELSFQGDENVLEFDSGDGCTTL